MGTGKRGTRDHNKRNHWEVDAEHDGNEEFVDDLAFASTFAVIPSHGIGYATTDHPISGVAIPIMNAEANKKSDGDDNEIEVEDEESDEDDSDNDSSKNKTDQIKEDSDSDSDSEEDDDDNEDTEDQEDLVEALERMEPTNDDEDLVTTPAAPPKTENEVDGYKVPIQELESKLQFQLTVDEEGSKKKLEPKQLSLAGTVKNFMVMDRTLVVESQKSSAGPLDEGSLLVISNPETSSNDSGTKYIALGRIFEVFGPVSQPLYTIRLPSPPAPQYKTTPSEEDKPNQNGDLATSDDKNQGDNENQSSEKDVSIPTNVEDIPTPPTEEIEISNAPKTEQNVDRWAIDGIYTKYLTDNKDVAVFYIQDEAKLIDTGLVLRSSGKGCDASNLYDEEVVNSNEIYYSDDEQEREAKSKKKGGARRNQNMGRNRQPQQHRHQQRRYPETTPMPAGFHVQSPLHPPPPPPHTQAYNSSNHFAQALPSGFHHNGPSSYPPPPPPPPGHQSQGYYGQPQTYGYNYQFPSSASARNPSSAPPPPPPPPPRNPNEPPAYQY